jgi:CRISPR-associated endonuclease/helicase Cas3
MAELLAQQQPAWLWEALRIQYGVVLAALHDVGKVSPGFQSKCAAWVRRHNVPSVAARQEANHARISQKTVQDLLAGSSLRFWAAIVGAHHGMLQTDDIRSLDDGGETWSAERRGLVAELVREFGQLPDQPPPSGNSAMLWFNAGLIAVSDWLASDEHTFPPGESLDAGQIRHRAETQLDRIGFRPMSCSPGKVFDDLFPFLSAPNSLQALVSEAVRNPGIYVVEAPMGCGKTEAALIAAYNLLASGQATGLYFALPTQATSNRIHRRLEAFIDRVSPGAGTRLIHGSSWLLEKTDDGLAVSSDHGLNDYAGRDWFASSRRALLAPFGVGTVDQALLGVVAVKHFFVRQFALAGKVVILDEVHSYDLYTGTLLQVLVKRLRELGATVVILSATLTASRRQELLCLNGKADVSPSSYPLLSINAGYELLQRSVTPDAPKTIQLQFRPAPGLVSAALERARRGECVLWIRNTVVDAQETYRQLCAENQVGGPELGLLHARFPHFRRTQLEDSWLERLGKDETSSLRPRHGCVLISTQVAEQSVDIDADLLVTDLAPTDMLLQRIGRLWRHPRPRPSGCLAQAWITSPTLDLDGFNAATASEIEAAFGRSAKVYAPYVLLRTFALWHDRTNVTLPSDVRPLLETTYADQLSESPAWHALRKELITRKETLCSAALANSSPWQVGLSDDEGVQTRWNSSPTVGVLLLRAVREWQPTTGSELELLNGDRCELRPHQFRFATAQAIHRNLVQVPRWCVPHDLSSPPAWLRQYVAKVVVCKVTDGTLFVLPGGDDSGLEYRDDLGVVVPSSGSRHTARREEDESEFDD